MDYILPILLFAGLGILAGVLLTVAAKVFYVKQDERLEALSEALPQVNCGACGFTGCNAYAEAIIKNGEAPNLCRPGGEETAQKIGEILGIEVKAKSRQVAFVKCAGNRDSAKRKFEYDGMQSCLAAAQFYKGSKTCTNGCLGYGDCVTVCDNHAINIVNGVSVINKTLCTGCGKCAKVCPKNIIEIRPAELRYEVKCSSTAIGKITRSVCTSGCIGCKMCERACEIGAIKVENNFAKIDYTKCINCGKCKAACKMGVIHDLCEDMGAVVSTAM